MKGLKLVVAGGSGATDDYVALLKGMAKANRRIIFTGNVTGREKEELLANARVFIIPSCLEGLPIALLEAMSYGLVSIASDIGPHREVLDNGKSGFLFDHRDPGSLRAVLLETLSMRDEDLSGLRVCAREYVKREHDWEDITESTEGVYRELLP